LDVLEFTCSCALHIIEYCLPYILTCQRKENGIVAILITPEYLTLLLRHLTEVEQTSITVKCDNQLYCTTRNNHLLSLRHSISFTGLWKWIFCCIVIYFYLKIALFAENGEKLISNEKGEEIENSRVRPTLGYIWNYSEHLSKSTRTVRQIMQIILLIEYRISVPKWVFSHYTTFFQMPSHSNKTQLKFFLAYLRRCHFNPSFKQRAGNLFYEWRRCRATEEASKQIEGDRWRTSEQKSGRQERTLIQSSSPGVSKGEFPWEGIANFRSVWDSTRGDG
jgi:hypothetical protein